MCYLEELLTCLFGIKHGAFTRGTHVDDNALLIGGRVVVWICDCSYARHSKTHRQGLSIGIQAHGWHHTKQPTTFHSRLGWFNSLSNYYIDSGNNEP